MECVSGLRCGSGISILIVPQILFFFLYFVVCVCVFFVGKPWSEMTKKRNKLEVSMWTNERNEEGYFIDQKRHNLKFISVPRRCEENPFILPLELGAPSVHATVCTMLSRFSLVFVFLLLLFHYSVDLIKGEMVKAMGENDETIEVENEA